MVGVVEVEDDSCRGEGGVFGVVIDGKKEKRLLDAFVKNFDASCCFGVSSAILVVVAAPFTNGTVEHPMSESPPAIPAQLIGVLAPKVKAIVAMLPNIANVPAQKSAAFLNFNQFMDFWICFGASSTVLVKSFNWH